MRVFLLFYLMFFANIFPDAGSLSAQAIPLQKILADETLINRNSLFKISEHSSDSLSLTGFYPAREFNKKRVEHHPSKIYWIKFKLNSSTDIPLYLYTKDGVAKMQLYKVQNNIAEFVGQTGSSLRISDNSIAKNFTTIKIPPGKAKTFIVKLSSERYYLNMPEIYIAKEPFVHETNGLNVFSLITAGFQICLFLTSILFIFIRRRNDNPHYVLPFLLVNFTDVVYFLARGKLMIIEPDFFPGITNSIFWNALGDLNLIFYYWFYKTFFNIPRHSFTYKIILGGMIFWAIQLIVELTDFNHPVFYSLAQGYLRFATAVDFIVLFSIFIYVIDRRFYGFFYKVGALGLFVIVANALQLALETYAGSNWVSLTPLSLKALQMAVLFNMTCFIAAMIYNYIQSEKERSLMRLQLVEKELEHQKTILQERERISHDMHDDLGAGISALKLQAEYLKRKVTDENILTDINDLLKTSEDMNLSMREMLWSLNSSYDNLENFVKYSSLYAENFLLKSPVKLHIEKSEIRFREITSEVRRNLFLCLKEALNNIVKHSQANNVFLSFEEKNEVFTMKVEDDGIGISSQAAGNGLHNMQFRMSKSKGSLEMHSGADGTTLFFTLPL